MTARGRRGSSGGREKGVQGQGKSPEAGGAARERERKLARRLARGPTLLLDGATGTELERRGVPSELPLWSGHALLTRPEEVEAIHREYVASGAEILTANTFRTQRRALAKAGVGERAEELTRTAVDLARRAADTAEPHRTVWVAGSIAPLEDCYHPELVPNDAALAREHAEHVRHLTASGVDLLLVETMNCAREARAALRAARAAGPPVWVSFLADASGRLPSGEPLVEVGGEAVELGAEAVLVNCLAASEVEPCLHELRRLGAPFGVYANLGAPTNDTGRTRSEEYSPEAFAELALRWRALGARVLGGCCGTTPAHIAAIARRLS